MTKTIPKKSDSIIEWKENRVKRRYPPRAETKGLHKFETENLILITTLRTHNKIASSNDFDISVAMAAPSAPYNGIIK